MPTSPRGTLSQVTGDFFNPWMSKGGGSDFCLTRTVTKNRRELGNQETTFRGRGCHDFPWRLPQSSGWFTFTAALF